MTGLVVATLFALVLVVLLRALCAAYRRECDQTALLEDIKRGQTHQSGRLMVIEGVLAELNARPLPTIYVRESEPVECEPAKKPLRDKRGHFVKRG